MSATKAIFMARTSSSQTSCPVLSSPTISKGVLETTCITPGPKGEKEGTDRCSVKERKRKRRIEQTFIDPFQRSGWGALPKKNRVTTIFR